jgi:hypothetical protein
MLRVRGSAKKAKRSPFAEGARVQLQVPPGLRTLYGTPLPANGAEGVVTPVAFGPQSTPYVEGPRGGLVFVIFGAGRPVGVSPEDLRSVSGSKGAVRAGRPLSAPLSAKTSSETFDVFLNRKNIDTVHYSGLKGTVDEKNEEVRRSLVNHDGYDSNIVVRRRPRPKGSPGVVRAGRAPASAWKEIAGSTPYRWPEAGQPIQIAAGAMHLLERQEFRLPEISGIVQWIQDDGTEGFLQILADHVHQVPGPTREFNRHEGIDERILEVHAPFEWWTPQSRWSRPQGSPGVIRKGRPAPPPQPIIQEIVVDDLTWKISWDPVHRRTVAVEGGFYTDEAIRYDSGKIAWDFPERIPDRVKAAVREIYAEVDRRMPR